MSWRGRTLLLVGALVVAACQRGERSQRKAKPADEAGESAGAEQRVSCGDVQCEVGQVCCNPSCAICTEPEGMCTQQFCDRASPPDAAAGTPLPPPAPLTCDSVRCAAGTHCELVDVQCVRAPCDPVPQCKPDAAPSR